MLLGDYKADNGILRLHVLIACVTSPSLLLYGYILDIEMFYPHVLIQCVS